MDDYEYEEERVVLMVELQGVFDPDLLLKQQKSIKILGLDTEEPVLQIGSCIFSGEYEDTVGTTVFFDKPQADGGKSESSCICKTDKKLTMKRVFLESKSKNFEASPVLNGLQTESSQLQSTEQENPVSDVCEVNFIPLSPEVNSIKCESPSKGQTLVETFTANTSNEQNISEHTLVCENSDENRSDEQPSVLESNSGDLVCESLPEVSSLPIAENSDDQKQVHNSKVSTRSPAVEGQVSGLSDAESEKSSEFDDLVIVSEIEDSNDALGNRCDSSLSEMLLKNASQPMEVESSEPLKDSHEEISNSVDGIRNPTEANESVEGIMNAILSEIQIMRSRISTLTKESDKADSASHPLIQVPSHPSNSPFPEPCDSASSCSHDFNENDDTEEHTNATSRKPVTEFDQNNSQQISTSQDIDMDNSSDIIEIVDEPMEVVIDDTDSMNSLHISAEVSELNPEFSDSSIIFASAVNSTVSDVNNVVNQPGTSSTLVGNFENEAKSVRVPNCDSNMAIPAFAKDSVDSTSNGSFQREKSSPVKSTFDIDSTTNETGDRLTHVSVNSSINLLVASSSENHNNNIDSTLNSSVDFEMREVGNSESSINTNRNSSVASLDTNHSIDSTSNTIRQLPPIGYNDNQDDVTESTSVSNSISIQLQQNEPPCEAAESSVSESLPINQVSESLQNMGVFHLPNNPSDYPDDNSASCKVTESHIDENQLPASIQGNSSHSGCIEQHFYPNEDNNTVTESHQYEENDRLQVSGSFLDGSCSSSKSVTMKPMQSDHDSELNVESSEQSQISVTESCTITSSARTMPSPIEHGPAAIPGCSSWTDDRFFASSTKYEDSRLKSYSLNQVTASSDSKSKLNSFTSSTISLSEESNRHLDTSGVINLGSNECNNESHGTVMESESEVSVPQVAMSSEKSENEVTESSASCSSRTINVTEINSEADALDTVSNSQELSRPIVTCVSTSGSHSTCEATESGENLPYIRMNTLESNDNEVSESCASNSRSNVHNSDISEAENDEPIFIVDESSSADIIAIEPCVSSNEQSQNVSTLENIPCVVTLGSAEGGCSDSRPSSSKEVTESNMGINNTLYAVADSPEGERLNDPCSSSSNKPDHIRDSDDHPFSRTAETDGHFYPEVSGCCSTSDDHRGTVNSGLNTGGSSENSQLNEAEVAESCTISDRRMSWDIAESNTDNEEGVLYIVTDSPETDGAEVSESCASSSNQCEANRESSAIHNPVAGSSSDGMEVTESCYTGRLQICNATESDMIVQDAFSESSSDSERHDSSANAVSDSTNIFNPASRGIFPNPEVSDGVEGDNSSSCEVTESHIQQSSGINITQSYSHKQFSVSRNLSPSSSDAASTSHGANSSRHWKKITSSTFAGPSTSSNAIPFSLSSWPVSSIVVSSANDSSQPHHSEASRGSSVNDANNSSAPASSEPVVLNAALGTESNENRDSVDVNLADSTGDNASQQNRYVEQPPDGSDNSKFPSSTSN